MSPTRREVLAAAVASAVLGRRAWAGERPAFGMTGPISGPNAFLGRSMRWGIELALADAPFDLVVYDDSYQPDVAAANLEVLARDPRVVAAIGSVGTPTSLQAAPIAAGSLGTTPMAYYGALTGSMVLRSDREGFETSYHYRASYRDELDELVHGFRIAGIQAEDIALLAQSDQGEPDGYGSAIRDALLAALKRARLIDDDFGGFLASRTVTVERNTTEVHDAVHELYRMEPAPRVILLGCTHLPAAKAIRMLTPVRPRTRFAAVSFVGSEALVQALGDRAEGVAVTQVVPPLGSARAQPFLDLAQNRSAQGIAPSHIALEGFLATRTLLRLITGVEISRAGILRGLAGAGELDSATRQLGRSVWPTVVRGGELVDLDWASLRDGP